MIHQNMPLRRQQKKDKGMENMREIKKHRGLKEKLQHIFRILDEKKQNKFGEIMTNNILARRKTIIRIPIILKQIKIHT